MHNLALRARICQATRDFFREQGYLEVETPLRIPAPAPEAHIEPFTSEAWFLQSSPELCMKRLLASGFTKLFQLCKCFRKDERGRHHLTELTMLEWYTAGHTYKDLMAQTRDLIQHIAARSGKADVLTYQGCPVSLSSPWETYTVAEAFDAFAGMNMDQALEQGRFDELMAFEIEPKLGRRTPCFIKDYPASLGALARISPDDPKVAERFELYIAGIELANGFSELTDPAEQRRRFETELDRRRDSNLPPLPMPERFLSDLAAMPDAAGIALGMDRLVMLFADAETVDDVVSFTPEHL